MARPMPRVVSPVARAPEPPPRPSLREAPPAAPEAPPARPVLRPPTEQAARPRIELRAETRRPAARPVAVAPEPSIPISRRPSVAEMPQQLRREAPRRWSPDASAGADEVAYAPPLQPMPPARRRVAGPVLLLLLIAGILVGGFLAWQNGLVPVDRLRGLIGSVATAPADPGFIEVAPGED